MIIIINYGMGNLRNVEKALASMNQQVKISDNIDDIKNSDAIILPGVGSFKSAMDNLRKLNLVDTIVSEIKSKKPFLGICLGMQVLFEKSEEGNTSGLGILKGKVKRFKHSLKVPHMGWNTVRKKSRNNLFEDIPDESFFYFVHSYYVGPLDKSIIVGETEYGIKFASAIAGDNIYVVQFHPEKSQSVGLKLINNFIYACKKNNTMS